jgi:hypothetical protein
MRRVLRVTTLVGAVRKSTVQLESDLVVVNMARPQSFKADRLIFPAPGWLMERWKLVLYISGLGMDGGLVTTAGKLTVHSIQRHPPPCTLSLRTAPSLPLNSRLDSSLTVHQVSSPSVVAHDHFEFHATPKQRQTQWTSRQLSSKRVITGTSSAHHLAPTHVALSLTTMSSSRARSAKRQRTFGAPTEDDDPAAQLSQARYQNAVSTRTVSGPLPSLATCCARVFVRHIEQLSADQHVWEAVLGWLKLIPEPLVPKLFAMLKVAHPTLLKSEFIVCVSARL